MSDLDLDVPWPQPADKFEWALSFMQQRNAIRYGHTLPVPKGAQIFYASTPGIRVQELHLPAQWSFTKSAPTCAYPFVISKGKVSVYAENSTVQIIDAPYTGLAEPGVRKMVNGLTDFIWTDFYPESEVESTKDQFMLNMGTL